MRSPNGPTLAELKSGVWDLYKVYELNAILDMEEDHKTAAEDKAREDANKPGKGVKG